MSKQSTSRADQRGVSLVIVLLFLVMLSILGTTAIQTSSLEEKMTGNERDRQIAFEAAEAALRDAEREIFQSLNPNSPFVSTCVDGLCMPATTAVPQWEAVDWLSATPRQYGAFTGVGAYPVTGLANSPRYIIELLPRMAPTSGNSAGMGAMVAPERVRAPACRCPDGSAPGRVGARSAGARTPRAPPMGRIGTAPLDPRVQRWSLTPGSTSPRCSTARSTRRGSSRGS
jgi:type IV pilus assembly protein PilX